MSEGTDLLKLVTNRVAAYLTTPAEEKEKPSKPRVHWTTQWFGMVPMGMQIWWDDKRGKTDKPQAPGS